MHFLDVCTIVCVGLMTGNELTVSLFINPVLWQLDDNAQVKALSLFARLLGKVMPVWYALCLIFMIAEAYLRRHESGRTLFLVAIAIWIAIILYTVAVLVPINNRIASLQPGSITAEWRTSHKKWDTLHRWRILFLITAMVCLIYGILGAR
ncbi:MAG TPA: DUF1772 domain-containing protein [Acidobacteriaceae bacterium]|nr:DUF1772 domain-containing protein [Acidobacteriaceae bacterium]